MMINDDLVTINGNYMVTTMATTAGWFYRVYKYMMMK
jgi:hypothetical protein